MRIIIIGCGRVGAGVAQSMSMLKHHVTIVDKDGAAFERLGPGFKGERVIGIGFDRDVLVKAGIQHADGLAAVTSSDEANVLAARMARQIFHVPRVIARVYDPRQAEIYDRLGLQTIATTTWGIQRISEMLQHTQADVILSLGNGQVDLVEEEISPLLEGKTVNELTLWGNFHVVAISRGGRTFLPTLGTVLQAGDLVYIAAASDSIARLASLLGR